MQTFVKKYLTCFRLTKIELWNSYISSHGEASNTHVLFFCSFHKGCLEFLIFLTKDSGRDTRKQSTNKLDVDTKRFLKA